jgi:hypothetical protein
MTSAATGGILEERLTRLEAGGKALEARVHRLEAVTPRRPAPEPPGAARRPAPAPASEVRQRPPASGPTKPSVSVSDLI